MTIIVFAPKGRVPTGLSRLSMIGTASKLHKGCALVTQEDQWGTTDFYCTTSGITTQLERWATRLHARLVFLPRLAEHYDRDANVAWLLSELTLRQKRREPSRIRLSAASDIETMLGLAAAPSIPLFSEPVPS
jgi:hypothetical protein